MSDRTPRYRSCSAVKFSLYRACRRSLVRSSAPFCTKSTKSRVVVAGDAPVIVL
jgi:hypothetical protein